ncbi:MAG: translocation/assembly module TamB domain-containing protein [Sideroxydans sp.]
MDTTGNFPLSRRSRWLLGLALPLLLLAGGAWWLAGSSSGLRWLMVQAERRSGGLLTAQGVAGGLFGTPHLGLLTLRGDGWQVELHDVSVAWTPSRLLRGEVEVVQVQVRRAEVRIVDGSDAPPVLPDTLQLPVALHVLRLDIGELRQFAGQDAQPAWTARQVAASLASERDVYRWQLMQAQVGDVRLSARGELATGAPFALQAQAQLTAPVALARGRGEAQATLRATGDLHGLQLQMQAQEGETRLVGEATLTPLAVHVLPVGQWRLDGFDARRYAAEAPHTRLSGTLELRAVQGGWRGPLRLFNADDGRLEAGRLPVRGIQADLAWRDRQITLEALRVSVPEAGQISGRAAWDGARGEARADLQLNQVMLAAVHGELPQRRVAGALHWRQRGDAQQGRFQLDDGELVLSGDFEQHGRQLELRRVRLAHGMEVLEGRGALTLSGARPFHVEADLHHLNLAAHGAPTETDLNARLVARGTLQAPPAAQLSFELARSRFGQREIGGSGEVDYRTMQDLALSGHFQLGDNSLHVAGSLGRGEDRLQLKLTADDLAQIAPDWGGRIEGEALLTGRVEAPQLTFRFSGDELTLPGQRQLAHFATQGELAADKLEATLAVQRLTAADGILLPQARLTVSGRPDAHRVQATVDVAQTDAWQEQLTLSAQGALAPGAGGWRDATWQGELSALNGAGVLPFALQAPASLHLSAQRAELGTATLALAGGRVQLSETRRDAFGWRSRGSISGIRLRAINLSAQQADTTAYGALQLGGEWQVERDQHWRGKAALWREVGDWAVGGASPVPLGLTDLRLEIGSEQDRLALTGQARGTQLGELALDLALPLTAQDGGWGITPDSPLRGRLRLDADDIGWLGPLVDESVRTEGMLQVAADIGGTLSMPRLIGQADGHRLALTLLDQGVQLEQGELQLDLRGDRIDVTRLEFAAPLAEAPRDPLLRQYRLGKTVGRLNARGTLDLAQGGGDLAFEADHLPLLQKPGRWVIASGQGRIGYAGKKLDIAGALRAEAGLIDEPGNTRPTLADDVVVAGREAEARGAQNNRIEASLDLGDHFYLRASGLEARLTGHLDVRARPGLPLAVTGVIKAQDAVFDAYGQKLEVERGLVNFVGELDDPALDIRAVRKGLSVEAGVEVSGTARHPVTRLVSTPNVPEAEKLSWIVLGRVPDSSGFDSSLLLAAATNILGGESANRVGRALGVDELSLRQQETGDPLQSQVVTVGKRLNARAYLSYEQGLDATQGMAKFSYTLSPRVTLVTRTGVEDAIDLFYSFRFY